MRKRIIAAMLTVALAATLLNGCGNDSSKILEKELEKAESSLDIMEAFNGALVPAGCDNNYRTTYEVFVYSFCDSNGDGIGDFNGLNSKLDYIKDLGCNAIWLMPIMPSPTYHKYDVTDYLAVDSAYGTMEDFDKLVASAHEKGIDIYIDMVLNHTSSEHPWFKEACKARINGDESNPYYDYYNFTDEVKGGFEKVPGSDGLFYEARFWSGMPDLNLDNEQVRGEIESIVDFWFDKDVDGFRLDACTSYYTGRDDLNIEFLSWFNSLVKDKKSDAYIVGEVWTDSVTYSKYLASGIDSVFEFKFSQDDGAIAKAMNTGNAKSFGAALVSADKEMKAANPDYVGAPFYTNHDTARTAGYYAGETSEAKTKMGWAMSLLMSGNSFLYYGEEIGMKGNGADENKRVGMRWFEDASAEGMCTAVKGDTKQKFDSLELQQEGEESIYNFVKETLKIRNSSKAITQGEVTFLEECSDDKVCVIQKTFEDETVTLVYNLSAEKASIMLPDSLKDAGINSVLVTGGVEGGFPALEGGMLEVPGYSLTVLK